MRKTVKRIGLGLGTAALAVALAGAGYEHLSAQAPDQGGRPGAGRFGGPGGPGGPMGRRGGPGGPGGPAPGLFGPMMGRLDLTGDQRDRVRQIMESHRADEQQLAERAMKAHDGLQEAITGTFDESVIRARAGDVAAVEADQAVLQARVYNEVVQILTAEQQEKLKTLQAEMKDRRAKMQQRRADGQGRRQQR